MIQGIGVNEEEVKVINDQDHLVLVLCLILKKVLFHYFFITVEDHVVILNIICMWYILLIVQVCEIYVYHH